MGGSIGDVGAFRGGVFGDGLLFEGLVRAPEVSREKRGQDAECAATTYAAVADDADFGGFGLCAEDAGGVIVDMEFGMAAVWANLRAVSIGIGEAAAVLGEGVDAFGDEGSTALGGRDGAIEARRGR